jgi:hypothetical protein
MIRVDDIDQVMRYGGPFRFGGLGCSDIHEAIDLHGISPDDLSRKIPRKGDRETGLADSRGPADHDNFRQVGIVHDSPARP